MFLEDIAWLIFIRAGSSRFPMKCYEPICGMNILRWLSKRSKLVGIKEKDLYVCTSRKTENIGIARQAMNMGHGVLLGPEEYPIMRIIGNWLQLKKYRYFVRICGDSPFYPFRAAVNAISSYKELKPYAITNTRNRIFPAGFSIEVYDTKAFSEAVLRDDAIAHEEHMCNILAPDRFLGAKTVDMFTEDSLDFFAFSRYTVDLRDDIKHIEHCILSGHARECEMGLDNVKYK
jgi:spore coat polysaccharide biosynthesis protein SpsF (cytidylyltransferase family)